ncbi:hypothetical protein CFC21_004689 [Triticum aestivum]|uniref:Bifunctional inhibitor/plant lipid transfer protein/seed storage helical domain-containing protein n=2 Tax=Triticum aestivum TaxID=4565 RepID=A0A9R1D844_WHEAT|nr:hypothetical protein CFC21_004689 [Triticum aestivum]
MASAQSRCTAALVGLYSCMNYISGNDTAPTKSCCSQHGSVMQSQPQCLCSALSGASSSLGGMTINKKRTIGGIHVPCFLTRSINNITNGARKIYVNKHTQSKNK